MNYSAQHVRAKTRAAVKRREDLIEAEEMESGELNLIPYLDMVTNLMLFMMASISAGLILSQMNTTLPDKAPKGQQVTPPTNPDDQPLGLYVSIQRSEMVLWSVSKLEGTRRSLFEELDRPALRPLPVHRFEIAQWKTKVGVGIDYHVQFDHHYYSVPYQLTGERVEVRATATIVECFSHSRRVASHRRSSLRGKFTTDPSHRPKAHQQYAEWTPSRIIRWAETIGAETGAVAQHILKTKPHPEHGFRSCLGLIRLADKYTKERVENACRRARGIGSPSYTSVKSILATGLDRQAPATTSPELRLPFDHEGVRGAEYYE
jgi:biopolymer transport protein ExbD